MMQGNNNHNTPPSTPPHMGILHRDAEYWSNDLAAQRRAIPRPTRDVVNAARIAMELIAEFENLPGQENLNPFAAGAGAPANPAMFGGFPAASPVAAGAAASQSPTASSISVSPCASSIEEVKADAACSTRSSSTATVAISPSSLSSARTGRVSVLTVDEADVLASESSSGFRSLFSVGSLLSPAGSSSSSAASASAVESSSSSAALASAAGSSSSSAASASAAAPASSAAGASSRVAKRKLSVRFAADEASAGAGAVAPASAATKFVDRLRSEKEKDGSEVERMKRGKQK